MKRIISPLLALTVLSGCATQAMQTMHSDRGTLVAAHKALAACIAPINGDPQYAPLAAHMSLTGNPTIEQMADTSYATPAEAKLLENRFDRLQPCDQAYTNQLEYVSQDAGDAYTDAIQAGGQAAISLARQQITWGQYNTDRQNISTRGNKQIRQALGELDRDLDEENAQEQQARAQAWANVSAAMAASQPHTTNCTSFGSSTSCTTY